MIARTGHLAVLVALAGCFSDPPGVDDEGSTGSESSGSGTASTSATTPTTSTVDTSSTSVETTDPDSSGTETGTSTSTGTDDSSTGEPGSCDPEAAFGAPLPMTELNSDNNDDRAWLSDDETVIYWSSSRGGGGYDIWSATRESLGTPWENIAPLAGAGDEERGPALTADTFDLFAAASPPKVMEYDIVIASRNGALEEFGDFAPVVGVNSEFIDRAPWINEDATLLYFESNRDTSMDIWRTSRTKGGVFTKPEPVGELNTGAEEGAPVLQAGGLTIYFSSNRDGGLGDYDIWVATRSDIEDGFGDAEHVPEVSSGFFDWPTWVSPDGCRLYLASRTDGGDYDLYVAERP